MYNEKNKKAVGLFVTGYNQAKSINFDSEADGETVEELLMEATDNKFWKKLQDAFHLKIYGNACAAGILARILTNSKKEYEIVLSVIDAWTIRADPNKLSFKDLIPEIDHWYVRIPGGKMERYELRAPKGKILSIRTYKGASIFKDIKSMKESLGLQEVQAVTEAILNGKSLMEAIEEGKHKI